LLHTKAFADAPEKLFPPKILDGEWLDPFVVAEPKCVDPDRWWTKRRSQKDEENKRRKMWR